MSVNSDALFRGGDAHQHLFPIKVGTGRAIRDMITVSDDFLILAGPYDDASNEKVGWVVARWDGQDTSGDWQTKTPGFLDLNGMYKRPYDHKLKPEALMLVAEKPGEPYQAVIFPDGMCDGGPLRFTIPR
jgi:hypothetical protein